MNVLLWMTAANPLVWVVVMGLMAVFVAWGAVRAQAAGLTQATGKVA